MPAGGGWAGRGETILVIEDDRSLREGLAMNFKAVGYKVLTARDGPEGMHAVLDEHPDLVVLDLMLPGMSGLEILQEMRARKVRTPVVILSAMGALPDKLEGFGLGADDYVTKPFDLPELLARVDAALRRRREEKAEWTEVAFGDVRVDFRSRTVSRRGAEVHLTPREFDLLALLVRSPRRAFARDHILRDVWGYDYEGTARTVDNFILSLRQKIEDDPQSPRYVVTVRSVGYRFDP